MNLSLNEKQSGIIILVLHIVGVAGYVVDDLREYFLFLTPFNLTITLLLLFNSFKDFSISSILLLITIYLIGFFSEYLGVNHQLLFGSYTYGSTLGIQLAGVPLMIGFNWILLAIVCSAVVSRYISTRWFAIPLAALLMVGLDFLIEPVAIAFDYWTWTNQTIPLSNYIGWFMVGLMIQIILSFRDLSAVHGISKYIVVAQVIFFASLNGYLLLTENNSEL